MRGRVAERRCEAARVRFGFVSKGRLASDLRASLPRDALVYGNPVQPRRDFRFAAEVAEVPEGGEKRLLGGIARVLLAAEHAVSEREDAALPPAHELAKSLGIAGQGTLNDDLVGSQSFHVREQSAAAQRFRR